MEAFDLLGALYIRSHFQIIGANREQMTIAWLLLLMVQINLLSILTSSTLTNYCNSNESYDSTHPSLHQLRKRGCLISNCIWSSQREPNPDNFMLTIASLIIRTAQALLRSQVLDSKWIIGPILHSKQQIFHFILNLHSLMTWKWGSWSECPAKLTYQQ